MNRPLYHPSNYQKRGTRQGYDYMLGIDPLTFLEGFEEPSWLDIMCGKVTALRQARFRKKFDAVGIDLIDHRNLLQKILDTNRIEFIQDDVEVYEPVRKFDLITSVFGIHYSDNPLAVLSSYYEKLNEGGMIVTNIGGNPPLFPYSRSGLNDLGAITFRFDPFYHQALEAGHDIVISDESGLEIKDQKSYGAMNVKIKKTLPELNFEYKSYEKCARGFKVYYL